VGTEVNVDKVKHIFMFVVQSREKIHIKIPQNNKSLGNIKNFHRVETSQNSMHDEINITYIYIFFFL